MSLMKVVRNNTEYEQLAIIGGERRVLAPYMTQTMDKYTAKEFISQCSPYVEYAEGLSTFDSSASENDAVWLYNATGDPAAEPLIERKIYSKGGHEELVQENNPLYPPHVVKWRHGGGQIEGKERGSGQVTALNMPSRYIEIYPYTRRAFSKVIADWLIMKDSQQETHCVGRLRKARPPQVSDPNETWELNKLRAFVKTIDSTIDVGRTLNDLKKEYDNGNYEYVNSFEHLVDQNKSALLKTIHFLICNPRRPYPDMAKFEDLFKKSSRKKPGPKPKNGVVEAVVNSA